MDVPLLYEPNYTAVLAGLILVATLLFIDRRWVHPTGCSRCDEGTAGKICIRRGCGRHERNVHSYSHWDHQKASMSEWYHAILYVAMIGGLAFTHRWAFDVGWPKIGVVLVLDVVVAIGFAIQFIQWLVDTVGVNLVKFFYVLSSRPGLQEGEG